MLVKVLEFIHIVKDRYDVVPAVVCKISYILNVG